MPQYPSQSSESYTPDRLVAGLTQLVSESAILAAGQVLPRGALMGRITASGKLTLSTAAATDGSQVPYGILLDAFDATAGDVTCGVYIRGEFDPDSITFGAGQTRAGLHDALRAMGIFLKPVVLASGVYA